MSEYDAGLLNDYGGNVEWWQDYIRAEIGRCNDFHNAEIAALKAEVEKFRGDNRFMILYTAQIRHENATLKARAESLEAQVELAKRLSDAVWEWHKNVSIWLDPRHPYLTIHMDKANAIFAARLAFDNSAKQILGES